MSISEISQRLQKETDKDYGIGVMINATELTSKEKMVIPVSPAIDIGLGGGIPEGSWVIISGPEKCGKSVTALQIAANAQKMGKFVYYYNAEGRLKKRDLESINNLDYNDNFKIVQSTQEKIMVSEDFLTHCISVIKSHPNSVVIIDSVSSLCSRQEFDADMTGQSRSMSPKLLASFCRQMGTVTQVQNTIVIMTLHMIANTSGYGSPFYEDSGHKVQYQADVKLRCKSVTPWKVKEDQIGQIVTWEVRSSALSGTPGTKVNSYLRYGYGLDKIAELTSLATDFGIIEKSGGGWSQITIDGEKIGAQIQGEAKVAEYLSKNPDVLEAIYNKVRSMV